MYIGSKQIGKLVFGNVSELEEKTVDLSMSGGNQVVNASAGKSMSKVTVNKPATMLPENIKKDIVIGGVTGTFEGVTNPVEIATAAEMDALLVAGNVGKVYKFTGTTGTYTNGKLYTVEEE